MLTKGNCIALVLVPPIMIVLLRRWSILKRPGLYVSAAIVAILGAPWQFVTIRMLRDTVPIARFTPARLADALSNYAGTIIESTGYLVLFFAIAGLAFQLWRGDRERRVEAVGLASLAAAVYFLHVGSPYVWDPRYVTPMLSVIAIFFAAGIAGVCDLIPAASARRIWIAPLVATVILAIYVRTTFKTPVRTSLGYIPVVEALTGPDEKENVILVCADGFGEGAAVEQIALGDRRPDRFVLRGSKVISEGRWSLRVHDSLLKTPDELQTYLLSVPVDAVVIDRTAPLWQEDTDMMLKTMGDNPGAWQLYREIPAQGTQRNILVYRYIGPRDPSMKRDISVRMRFILGTDLSLKDN
jgi:hypothetical protein